jgi:hypothetical protein
MTNTTQSALDALEVTQADEYAAEGFHGPFCNAFGPTPLACSCGVREAFARHRIAVIAAAEARGRAAERGDVVAWLRDEGHELLRDDADRAAEALGEAAYAIEAGEHLAKLEGGQ